jgi:hypothetical protein
MNGFLESKGPTYEYLEELDTGALVLLNFGA